MITLHTRLTYTWNTIHSITAVVIKIPVKSLSKCVCVWVSETVWLLTWTLLTNTISFDLFVPFFYIVVLGVVVVRIACRAIEWVSEWVSKWVRSNKTCVHWSHSMSEWVSVEWVYEWVCEWLCECVSEWVSKWVSECVNVWVYKCVCECVYKCVCECVSECVNVWVSAFNRVSSHVSNWASLPPSLTSSLPRSLTHSPPKPAKASPHAASLKPLSLSEPHILRTAVTTAFISLSYSLTRSRVSNSDAVR